MAWTSLNTARRVVLLLACLASVLCSPVSGFVRSPTSLSSVPSYPGASHQCNNRPVHFLLIASSTSTSPLARSAFGGTRQAQRAHKPPVVAVGGRGGASSRLWMSSPAPPVKPPKKRGYGGGGRGDDLYVRELLEPEKSEVLTTWKRYAVADGGDKFAESIQILNEMIDWRSGVTAARKRQFTLACCKGETVQAVACVRIGPKNDAVRSFFAQEACMSLCLLNVDPASPQFKAGAHLCKEIKEIGKLENMAVSFQPIKDIYSGRFYAATLTM